MRLLITGASGFVGGHVLPALAAAFPDATLVGCGDAPGMEKLDLADAAAARALVRRIRPAGIIHLAAIAAPAAARRDPARAWAVNHHGTLALAHALAATVPGAPVQRGAFVFASSAEIYGRSFRGTPLDEAAPPAPLNPYAATKAAADLALAAIPGIACVRLRPFNHTGPGQSPDYVVPAFARQVARIAAGLQPPVMAVGPLDTARDFLDVRDVARAYALALAHALAGGSGVYNIASGTPRGIGDILAALLHAAAITPEVQSSGRSAGPAIAAACGNAAAACATLGWQPVIAWAQTLADVLGDWQQRAGTGA